MHLLLTVSAVVSFVMGGALANTLVEPLCQTKVCPSTQVCRIVETCAMADICQHEAVCIPQADNNNLVGGCDVGEPLLEMGNVSLQLRTCYTSKNCAPGFLCSTALQDTSSRCCRAKPEGAPKEGSCPALEQGDLFFCVDECRSDADCRWGDKCCQKSRSCTRKRCSAPDPCSLQTCPAGQRCVVTPSFTASCEPDGQPTIPPTPSIQPPMPPTPSIKPPVQPVPGVQPLTNPNTNTNTKGGLSSLFNSLGNGSPAYSNVLRSKLATMLGGGGGARVTCPSPLTLARGECSTSNMCGHGSDWSCAAGKLCCATRRCGNLCRSAVAFTSPSVRSTRFFG